MPRKRLKVQGRVQGIGYRWFVRDAAARLALRGWVRNLDDGAVEAEAEGPAEALAALLSALRSGHPLARVDGIDEKDIPERGTAEGGFRITGSD